MQGIVYGKSALLMGLCYTPKVYRPAQKTIVLPNPPTSQAEKAPIINLYFSLTIGKSTSLLRVRRIPFVYTLSPPPKESERKTFPLALFSRSQTLLQRGQEEEEVAEEEKKGEGERKEEFPDPPTPPLSPSSPFQFCWETFRSTCSREQEIHPILKTCFSCFYGEVCILLHNPIKSLQKSLKVAFKFGKYMALPRPPLSW